MTLHNAQTSIAGRTGGGMGPQGPMEARRHAVGIPPYLRAAGGASPGRKSARQAAADGRETLRMHASTGGSRWKPEDRPRTAAETPTSGTAGARAGAGRRRIGAPASWACLFITSGTRQARNEQRRGSPAGSARRPTGHPAGGRP